MRVCPSLALSRLLFLCTIVFAVCTSAARAQTFKVVYNFNGAADGANPLNGLMLTSTGVMYGTTDSGGAYDNGALFSFANGKATRVHSFQAGADGAQPQSFLIQDKSGNLYGTTYAGGAYGDGTVFRISGTTETILHVFGSHLDDGAAPQAGLTMDSAGNLYGTTTKGGTSGHGTVFMLSRNTNGTWTEKTLHNFSGDPDGSAPVAGVTLDSSGNVYGTTSDGGAHGYGTIFELKKASSWAESILHSFQNLTDGATPYAGLIAGPAGSLFGAATDGGQQGGGTVFQLVPASGKWNFVVITSLPGWGVSGSFRNLLFDVAANTIYATTHCDGTHNAGTIYQLSSVNGKWTYKLLYTFTGGVDGKFAFTNLVLSGGKLYGTTNVGGALGKGVIFELTP
jgi:uncharacterized repeat protein (TIGR03803 family)